MEYTFHCSKCNKDLEIELPMDKYTELKNSQRCPVCNSQLERKIEWTGSASINGGYEAVAGKGAWQN